MYRECNTPLTPLGCDFNFLRGSDPATSVEQPKF